MADYFNHNQSRRISRRELLRSTAVLSSGAIAPAVFFAETLPANAEPPGQDNWTHCTYCNLVFFDGYQDNKGRCAAYGVPSNEPHKPVGPRYKNYRIIYDDSTGPGQGDWRYCRKCGVLFFNGYPEKGSCAAGAGHEAAGWNFFLYHDRQPIADKNEEAGWRYCNNCFALFDAKAATNVGCPAANAGKGPHQAAGYQFILAQKILHQ